MRIQPILFSPLRAWIVKNIWRIRRKMPVIMTWDSLVEFERQSIRQGVAWGRRELKAQLASRIAANKADDIRAMHMDMQVTSHCIEIIERTGFGKGGDA